MCKVLGSTPVPKINIMKNNKRKKSKLEGVTLLDFKLTMKLVTELTTKGRIDVRCRLVEKSRTYTVDQFVYGPLILFCKKSASNLMEKL